MDKIIQQSLHIDCSILFADFIMSTCYFCWSGLYRSSVLRHIRLRSFAFLTQLDGRKKRRAKGFCLRLGFQIPGRYWITVFVSGTWILDSIQLWDSRFVEQWFGFQKQNFPGFQNPDSVTLDDDTAIEHSRKWITDWKPCRLKFYTFRALKKNEMCFAIQFALRYVINVCGMSVAAVE